MAGIGVELSTRRRNKLAGRIESFSLDKNNTTGVHLEMHVNSAVGNCPKYINIRELIPTTKTNPRVIHQNLRMNQEDRLPDELISLIHDSDTVFLGTSYVAPPEAAEDFPSHVGMNHRGGLPGFVRVRPSDGRTIVLPDFSGNRFMSSLGNVEVTPLASLTFINFSTGDILYITGEAKTLFGAEAEALMRRQKVLTTVMTTGYTFVRDALPLRQDPSVPTERSMYAPPIKFLNEEAASASRQYFEDTRVSLTKVGLLNQNIAVFSFELQGTGIQILPGQSVALDFTDFVGPPQYAHMNPSNPTSVNDDRIRTWTVSSAHVHGKTQSFELTMREKPGGLVTGALFTVARGLKESIPHVMGDCRVLGMVVRLVGVAGDFVLPPIQASPTSVRKKLLFVAGGIGITPFLSMLKAIRETGEERDVVLLISTREPDVLLNLVAEAISHSSEKLKLVVHVFSSQGTPESDIPGVELHKHSSRISQSSWANVEDGDEREVFLCGPPEFNKAVQEFSGLGADGIRSEGFNY